MKKSLIIMAMIIVAGVGCTEEDKKEVKVELESLSQKASYAVGLQIGQSMSTFPVEFDRAAFDVALDDSLSGTEPRLPQADLEAVFGELNKIHQEKMAAAGPPPPPPASADGDKNLEIGKAFLAENAKKEGVVTTDTGLQYVVIKEGEGTKPAAADRVEVHYLGTTINGNEFDSSYKRGAPATFGVTQVIPGWTEALQLMTVGSKYKLFIPSNLAYGPRGAGRDIGPNETLIFEVELISIQK
jgi:FKBP-type peptidyl-prolyl cis-trans isomerase